MSYIIVSSVYIFKGTTHEVINYILHDGVVWVKKNTMRT